MPRTTTTTRVAVQDVKAALDFAASANKVDCGADFIGTGDITVSGWVKADVDGGGGGGGRIINNTKFDIQINVPGKLICKSDNVTIATTDNGCYRVGQWFFTTITRTSAGVVNFRVNGVPRGTANQSSGTPVAGSNVILGNVTGGTRQIGKLSTIKVFNRILTISEQDALISGTNPSDYTTSIIRDFKLNEGSGTTAIDSSGNGNNGTITGATYTDDVPSKARKEVNANLVPNGDFSFVPPFTAATSTTDRWIDGTAAGLTYSTSIKGLHGWFYSNNVVNSSAQFDTETTYNSKNSIKVSCADTIATAFVASAPALTPSTYSRSIEYLIPIIPGTSYTLTAMVKTLNVPANSTYLDMQTFDGNKTTRIEYATSKLSGTNDWTQLSVTQVMPSDRRYAYVLIRKNAGAISDAWFADITLTPTTATTRTTATGRSAV